MESNTPRKDVNKTPLSLEEYRNVERTYRHAKYQHRKMRDDAAARFLKRVVKMIEKSYELTLLLEEIQPFQHDGLRIAIPIDDINVNGKKLSTRFTFQFNNESNKPSDRDLKVITIEDEDIIESESLSEDCCDIR